MSSGYTRCLRRLQVLPLSLAQIFRVALLALAFQPLFILSAKKRKLENRKHTGKGIFNACDLMKMLGIWKTKGTHTEGVSWLLNNMLSFELEGGFLTERLTWKWRSKFFLYVNRKLWVFKMENNNKGSPSHIDMIRADFTTIFYTKTMQLVQPIRNRLAIPAERQFERIVYSFFFFFFLCSSVCSSSWSRKCWLSLIQELLFTFPSCEWEATLHIRLRFV